MANYYQRPPVVTEEALCEKDRPTSRATKLVANSKHQMHSGNTLYRIR